MKHLDFGLIHSDENDLVMLSSQGFSERVHPSCSLLANLYTQYQSKFLQEEGQKKVWFSSWATNQS